MDERATWNYTLFFFLLFFLNGKTQKVFTLMPSLLSRFCQSIFFCYKMYFVSADSLCTFVSDAHPLSPHFARDTRNILKEKLLFLLSFVLSLAHLSLNRVVEKHFSLYKNRTVGPREILSFKLQIVPRFNF